MKKLRMFFFSLLFSVEYGLMIKLAKHNKQMVADIEELTGICHAQIEHIRELEDKIAHLEYEKEDLEIELEGKQ